MTESKKTLSERYLDFVDNDSGWDYTTVSRFAQSCLKEIANEIITYRPSEVLEWVHTIETETPGAEINVESYLDGYCELALRSMGFKPKNETL